jgi:hypothetical protein
MKNLTILCLLLTNFVEGYANGPNLTLTLLCNQNEIANGQVAVVTLKIKNEKNFYQYINYTSIFNTLSYLKFYKIENNELKEIAVGVSSTVSKKFFDKEIIIEPLSEIFLSQEILLADVELFNLISLTRYAGYALVLEDEGVFMPINEVNTTIAIQAKLRCDAYIFESNIVHIGIHQNRWTCPP